MSDPVHLSAGEQAEQLRSGSITATDLLDAHLARIEALEPRVNAFTRVRTEPARAEAAAAQERLDAGERAPLLGVPVAVKDNFDVAGEITSHGTGIGRTPAAADSEVVLRLRAAGAVIIGITTLPELAAFGQFTESATWGVTRNPWNTEHTPGGSSGGSAAAVAAGMAAVAVGTDGGASVRVPAAMCGLVGLKPQRGRIPLDPFDEHWHGMTHAGPLARDIADAALLFDVLAGSGTTYREAAASPPGRLRIAWSTKRILPARLRPQAKQGLEEALRLLRDAGHRTHEQDPRYGELRPLLVPRVLRGIRDDAEMLGGPEGLEPRTRTMVRLGNLMSERRVAGAREREAARAAQINELFDDADVLVTPTIAAPPPKAGVWGRRGGLRAMNGGAPWVGFTSQWNFTGQPALSLPMGRDADGLPLSVQLVARPDDEATILALAAQLEGMRGSPLGVALP